MASFYRCWQSIFKIKNFLKEIYYFSLFENFNVSSELIFKLKILKSIF